jgi:hypothetical protein
MYHQAASWTEEEATPAIMNIFITLRLGCFFRRKNIIMYSWFDEKSTSSMGPNQCCGLL